MLRGISVRNVTVAPAPGAPVVSLLLCTQKEDGEGPLAVFMQFTRLRILGSAETMDQTAAGFSHSNAPSETLPA